MGVVTVSGSAPQSPLGVKARLSSHPSQLRNPVFLAFKADQELYHKTKKTAAATTETELCLDLVKQPRKSRRTSKPATKRVKAVSLDGSPALTIDLDYNEAAAALENIYKLSPAHLSNVDTGRIDRRCSRTTKKAVDTENGEKSQKGSLVEVAKVVRNRRRKSPRLGLDKRVALRRKKVEDLCLKRGEEVGAGDVEKLVREYTGSTDLVTLDWKRMQIPPVLPSSEHAWLFKLMQPMKALLQVKENLHKDLNREPTDGEISATSNMNTAQVRRHMEVGRAARNKLIKHNLRLVLFVINKYYQELASVNKFQDLCQAGAKGLITAIDRFEPKRGNRLSTYGLFWIRHAIMRSITLSSFTRVSFGIESVRIGIQRARLELLFELGRIPTEDEIVAKVGISPERYRDVMRASKSVISLNARHSTTQEEFIKGITDIDGVPGGNGRQPALLRLALDDVLDSLKPKESLVIRQRYGLDGKGDRTLGEIAGNLNISREMVRKHEVKALMKLKHPARVDYLRRYVV